MGCISIPCCQYVRTFISLCFIFFPPGVLYSWCVEPPYRPSGMGSYGEQNRGCLYSSSSVTAKSFRTAHRIDENYNRLRDSAAECLAHRFWCSDSGLSLAFGSCMYLEYNQFVSEFRCKSFSNSATWFSGFHGAGCCIQG